VVVSVFAILDQLEAASGQNEKVKILKDNKDNQELYELLDYALSFKHKFYIKKFSIKPNARRQALGTSHQAFIVLLEDLKARKITGHEALADVESFFADCSDEKAKWYSRVLLKDLKCNFGLSLCKKAGIDIPEFEVMLAKDGKECKKLKEIVNAGVYASPKFNGYRCLAIKEDGEVTLHSRNGLAYENFPSVKAALEKIPGDFVVDGEIMSDDFNAMQQTAMSAKSNKSVGDVYYAIFGWVPVDEWRKQEFKVPTKQRLESLRAWFDSHNPDPKLIRCVEHKLIYSVEDALEYEKECIANKYEGAMLLPNIPYFLGKKSNKLLKLKTFFSMDCPILKIYKGEPGKAFEHTMGGVTVMQENGVECDCGSGWSIEDREYMWNHQEEFIGRIIEIQYQEIQKPHNRMQFPTFQRFRDDK
jgi:DNA ligase 1